MNNSIESLILHSLIYNEKYTRKVVAFLDGAYFSTFRERFLYDRIDNYFEEYNVCPTPEILTIDVTEASGISEEQEKEIHELLNELSQIQTENLTEEWMIDSTEKFCQDRAIHNAILDSITIINGENKKLDKGSIPKILSDALAVSFDANVGHDYIGDAEERFEFYKRTEKKIPFDIESLNKITKGGLSEKSFNVFSAVSGTGKSLAMCSFAASNLSMGYNVLYITMEMSEEKIAERIDANLLDVDISTIEEMPKVLYDRKMKHVRENTKGKLFVKEYPTAGAGANHFRALLDELKMKKNFKPDIIYIDYLNICSSSRLKMGNSVNSYTYVKSIAEELRGIAVEYVVPVVTATQTNRSGFADGDPGMEGTSDSVGTVFIADLLCAIVSTEEFQERGVFLFKQLKNRYNDVSFMRRFFVGVDYPHMRLFEVKDPTEGLHDTNTTVKKGSFDEEDKDMFTSRRRPVKYDGLNME